MKWQITEISQHKKGKLKLGVPSLPAAAYVMAFIYSAFYDKFPDIRIELTEVVSKPKETLARMIENDELDVGLMPFFRRLPGLSYEIIYKEEVLLVAKNGYIPKDYCLHDNIVDLKKIEHLPFIIPHKGQGIHASIYTYFKENGFSPETLIEIDNNSIAMMLAGFGAGIAVVPERSREITKKIENIDILRFPPNGMVWDIAAVWKTTNDDNFILNEFIKIAQDALKDK
jgi:DNA-binding transcriptional LysR family regulator